LLVACGGPVDDVVPRDFDATTRDASGPVVFADVVTQDVDAGPTYVGGPLACAACTCDGTLYACFEGICRSPPVLDAGADADDASDANASCGKNAFCTEIPIECLPKPTCECIEEATHLVCVVAPNGNGFALSCP
jgi:hypothetical protein